MCDSLFTRTIIQSSHLKTSHCKYIGIYLLMYEIIVIIILQVYSPRRKTSTSYVVLFSVTHHGRASKWKISAYD